MSAVIWIQLIAQIGLPAAERLFNLWKNNEEVTPALWDELRKKVSTPYENFNKGIVS